MQTIYEQYYFTVPFLTILDADFTDVYARIKGVNFDFETQQGSVLLHISENLQPKIKLAHTIEFSVSPQQEVGREYIVGVVLSNLQGSTVNIVE